MQSKVRKQWFQILVLLAAGIVFYLCLGQEWIMLEGDSPSYLYPSGEQGVMPVYPLFLFAVRYIFGEELYLSAVVVIQSLTAVICTMAFVLYLQKQFQLKFVETILLYIASMLPFSIYLPERALPIISLQRDWLMLSFIFILSSYCNMFFIRKRNGLLLTMAMSVFMALVRSQLIFIIAVTAAAFIVVEFVKHKESKGIRRVVRLLLNMAAGGAGALVMVLLVYKILGGYISYQLPVIEKYSQKTMNAESERSAESDTAYNGTAKAQTKSNTSQLTTLIVIRGVYEVDEEDIALFDTVEMQEIFKRVFAAVDEHQYRYVYARQDLYMWRDLVKDRISSVVKQEINEYLEENPELTLDVSHVRRELGMKILLHHFDRYLYHSIRLMISGFIASVFFQIERIYLLCHIITLLLFTADIIGIVYCFKYGRDKKTAAFALTTLGVLVLMIVIMCLIFVGIQRYVVYAMGIFYCSMYLMAREIFQNLKRNKV